MKNLILALLFFLHSSFFLLAAEGDLVIITDGNGTTSANRTTAPALPITLGGTGATNVPAARTNFGLGTAATLNKSETGTSSVTFGAVPTWETGVFMSSGLYPVLTSVGNLALQNASEVRAGLSINATNTPSTATGIIGSTNVQAALAEIASEFLPLTGGTPTGLINIDRDGTSASNASFVVSSTSANGADAIVVIASDAADQLGWAGLTLSQAATRRFELLMWPTGTVYGHTGPAVIRNAHSTYYHAWSVNDLPVGVWNSTGLQTFNNFTQGDHASDQFEANDDDPRFPNLTAGTYTAAADDKVALNGNVGDARYLRRNGVSPTSATTITSNTTLADVSGLTTGSHSAYALVRVECSLRWESTNGAGIKLGVELPAGAFFLGGQITIINTTAGTSVVGPLSSTSMTAAGSASGYAYIVGWVNLQATAGSIDIQAANQTSASNTFIYSYSRLEWR